MDELNIDQLDKLRAKIGFLFQSNALYDSMTVRENLEFPLRRHWMNVEQSEVNNMVIEALTNVGLEHTIDMMPVELSGGMRKRIALARTLMLRPGRPAAEALDTAARIDQLLLAGVEGWQAEQISTWSLGARRARVGELVPAPSSAHARPSPDGFPSSSRFSLATGHGN